MWRSAPTFLPSRLSVKASIFQELTQTTPRSLGVLVTLFRIMAPNVAHFMRFLPIFTLIVMIIAPFFAFGAALAPVSLAKAGKWEMNYDVD